MTKRDRRTRRSITLAPNAQVMAPVMAAADSRPLNPDSEPTAVQAAALSPDGVGFRIVHRPSPEAEVSGWVWAEPPNGAGQRRLGLWALGCGHCGTSDCQHVRATLRSVEEVLTAAPDDTTWSVAADEVPAALAERVRARAERHSTVGTGLEDGRTDADLLGRSVDDALRGGPVRDGHSIPYLRADATGGLAPVTGHRWFQPEIAFDLPNSAQMRRLINEGLPAGRVAALSPYHRADRIRTHLHDAGLLDSWDEDDDTTTDNGWTLRTHAGIGTLVGPRMRDDPRAWEQLHEACRVIREAGGVPDPNRPNLIRVGSDDYQRDVGAYGGLLSAVQQYEDVLLRLSQVPVGSDGTTRLDTEPRNPLVAPQGPLPDDGYTTLGELLYHHGDISSGPVTVSDDPPQVTFQSWSSSVDASVIQASVNVSLGLVDAASRDSDWGPRTRVGANWDYENEPYLLEPDEQAALDDHGQVRELARRIFRRADTAEQLVSLYNATNWQPSYF